MLKRAIIARTLHKWLGLFVGLQILIWLSSGLYMVVVNIDFIHGDTLVRNMHQAVAVPETAAIDMAGLRSRFDHVTNIKLIAVMGKTFYAVTTTAERYLLDPDNGEIISPLGGDTAIEIARYHFNGNTEVVNANLITSNPPMEIQTRRLPLWRVDFKDRYSTSFYVDPYSGALATRRFLYWRIFDFMWMLHIMDYEERADAHNLLLISAQITGLAFAISGLWLLIYSFNGRRKKITARR
jgi:uncharacterized iron-regulated membrane protein